MNMKVFPRAQKPNLKEMPSQKNKMKYEKKKAFCDLVNMKYENPNGQKRVAC